jgi:hypothetical protein
LKSSGDSVKEKIDEDLPLLTEKAVTDRLYPSGVLTTMKVSINSVEWVRNILRSERISSTHFQNILKAWCAQIYVP